jgi:hypothetical protein
MSDVRTRSSTGTSIGEAFGGAVRAATSAGDFILEPATQLAPAVRTTSARTRKIVVNRFLLMISPI